MLGPKVKEYLRKEVPIGLEYMLRNDSPLHLFDVDKERTYVFVMAIMPRDAIKGIEAFMVPTIPTQ